MPLASSAHPSLSLPARGSEGFRQRSCSTQNAIPTAPEHEDESTAHNCTCMCMHADDVCVLAREPYAGRGVVEAARGPCELPARALMQTGPAEPDVQRLTTHAPQPDCGADWPRARDHGGHGGRLRMQQPRRASMAISCCPRATSSRLSRCSQTCARGRACGIKLANMAARAVVACMRGTTCDPGA